MTNTPTAHPARRIALTATASLAVTLGGLMVTRPAWAHTPSVSAACSDGAPIGHVSLVKYPADTVVTVNGVSHTFAGAYSADYPLGSPSEAHTFAVVVVSPDGIGNLSAAINVAPCETPSTEAATSSTAPPEVPPATEAPPPPTDVVEVGAPVPPSTLPALVACPDGVTYLNPDELNLCPTTITFDAPRAGVGAVPIDTCVDGITDVRGAPCTSIPIDTCVNGITDVRGAPCVAAVAPDTPSAAAAEGLELPHTGVGSDIATLAVIVVALGAFALLCSRRRRPWRTRRTS